MWRRRDGNNEHRRLFLRSLPVKESKEVKQISLGKRRAEEFTVREKLIVTEGTRLAKEELPTTETEE